MQQYKTLFLSLGLVAIASVTYYLRESRSQKEQIRLIPMIDGEKLEQIQLNSPEHPKFVASYDKKTRSWITRDDKDIAIPIRAKQLIGILDFVNNLQVIQSVSTRQEHWEDYGTTVQQASSLTLSTDSQKHQILFGRESTEQTQFARLSTESTVYLVSARFTPDWKASQWYLDRILPLKTEALKRIHYATKDGKSLVLDYNPQTQVFDSKQTPKEQRLKDAKAISQWFSQLTVRKYIQRTERKKWKTIGHHRLEFEGDLVINLRFFRKTTTKRTDHFLEIELSQSAVPAGMPHLKEIADAYVFELAAYNPTLYERTFSDFFEPAPAVSKSS